jgi:hypothetical protein
MKPDKRAGAGNNVFISGMRGKPGNGQDMK